MDYIVNSVDNIMKRKILLTALIFAILLTTCILYSKESLIKTNDIIIEYKGSKYITAGYKIEADYNLILTNEFWKSITCPKNTKVSYTGIYREIEHCEHSNDGNEIDTLSFLGIDFVQISNNFQANPGIGKVKARWFVFDEAQNNKSETFKLNRYYIFCFKEELSEKWLNLKKEASCDIEKEELDKLNCIIMIEPTFDFSNTTFPITLTVKNIKSLISQRRSNIEYEIVKNQNSFSVIKSNKSVNISDVLINKTLYSILTSNWIPTITKREVKSSPHVYKIKYEQNNKLCELLLIYDNGNVILDDNSGKYWITAFPLLMYEVEEEIEKLFKK